MSTPLPRGAILLAININQKLLIINVKWNRQDPQSVYQNRERLLSRIKQYAPVIYRSIYISIYLSIIWGFWGLWITSNYNSYAVIYVSWLRQSCYVFTEQLKLNVRIYKVSKDRYNVVKLSLHMFTA